jgi:hypothetical protein
MRTLEAGRLKMESAGKKQSDAMDCGCWQRPPSDQPNRKKFSRNLVAGVPELTDSADIKLNTRLSLRAPAEKITSRTGYFPGLSVAKPSVEHFPAGGFV